MIHFQLNGSCIFLLRLTQHYECIPTTMNTRLIKKQMRDLPLLGSDSARLILESIESLGRHAEGLSRIELVCLLRRVIMLGIAAIQAEEQTESFEKAAWASVAVRTNRRPTTTRDLRHYVRRMLRVEGVGQMPLRGMTASQCRMILQKAFGQSVHSYRKGRVILHSIFAYGMRQEWCDSNPVDRIDNPEVEERAIAPLNQEEVMKLNSTAATRHFKDMRFSLSLLLYSGVRPAEVERISPEDVCWEERQVIIRARNSKTGGGRVVPLRPLPGLRQRDCYVPPNWQNRWLELRRAAGFTRWVPDICRHTFATYHAAYFRNLPELQLEMGHRDISLLRSRYMAPALRKSAKAFWRIVLKQ